MSNKSKGYSILLIGLVILLASSIVACGEQVPPPPPTIALSPLSLSFSAGQGEYETTPVYNVLSIWNSGSGTLHWSLRSSADWVVVGSYSGVCIGEVDNIYVYVNHTGLELGSYAATITISAEEASNSPQTIPISLMVTGVPTGEIQPSPKPTGYIPCSFTWEYAGREWNWGINVSKVLYDYYKDKPRVPTEDYSLYVTDPYDDDFISSLVESLGERAQQQGWNEWETINFAVSFVQSLPYTSDLITTPYDEYPRYPVETLVDDGGDCEDTSILMAAILDSMGYGVVLISPPEHMAVGVLGGEGIYGSYYEHNGQKYFYLETTGEGWKIGEIPDEYKGETAHIYDIVPTPILTHNWTTTASGWHVTLEVTVNNRGTAVANDAYILAGFDAGNGMLWNIEKSSLFDLDPGYSKTITLTLDEPRGKHTRLVVQIVDDGYAVDESHSEWFDT
jgi:hypothetical protein